MDYKEFSSKIKQKYPQYQDMDDQDLAQRMVKKYPQYSDVSFGKSFMGINRQNLPQSISAMARPALEMGGAVGGAALASPGIFTTPAGGALGFAAGKASSDLLDRILGVKKPLQNIKQAGMETAKDIGTGMEAEAGGQIGGKVLSVAAKPVGRFMGNMGRIISGVKPEMGERLFKDPGAFLSPSLSKAGQELGSIRSDLGMTSKPTINEVIDTEASTARKTVKEMYDKLQSKTANASDLLKGTQSIDDVIQATPTKQVNKRRMLFELKREFTDALKDVAPEERGKAKQYARSALAGEFRKFFPVTKAGDVSVLRTLGLGALGEGGRIAAVIPSLLQSPALAGTGISGAGSIYKVLQDPIVRRAIVSAVLGNINQ